MNWKKGRGKLGMFEPLIGSWDVTEASEETNECEVCSHIRKDTSRKIYSTQS